MHIERIEKKTHYRWLNLFEIDYVGSDGKPGKWQFVSRNPNPKLGKDPLHANAVIIVPLHMTKDQTRLVVIREFRVPLGDYEYAVPAGLFDYGEDLLTTVLRELKEETGLEMTKLLVNSEPVVSSAGLSDEAVQYVFVECTGEPHTKGNEATEDITVELLDLEDIKRLRRSGAKMSAKLWPILLMFECMNGIFIPQRVLG